MPVPRKHRAALAIAGAFAGLLVVGVLVSSVLAVRARRAEADTELALDRATDEEKKARRSAAEARTVLSFFQDQVLAATRPESLEGGLGKDATIRQAVDAAEPKIAAAFSDQAAAEASISQSVGAALNVSRGVGDYWFVEFTWGHFRHGEHDRGVALQTRPRFRSRGSARARGRGLRGRPRGG